MTQSTRLCEWCGEPFPTRSGPGRPQKFCRRSHRQRHYEARLLGEHRSLGEDEVLLSRRAWEQLRDALYRLQSATEDVALDVMHGKPTKAEYLDALVHLTEAIRELQEVSVEPLALRAAAT